jgi:hypothetical protein
MVRSIIPNPERVLEPSLTVRSITGHAHLGERRVTQDRMSKMLDDEPRAAWHAADGL